VPQPDATHVTTALRVKDDDSAPGSPQTTAPNTQRFSTRDLEFIIKFCQEFAGDQFRHLVHALCPAIYGHELIKACAHHAHAQGSDACLVCWAT
jgi:hypothetical protein